MDIINRLPISIKEARKLLGSECVDFTDEEVEDIIEQLYFIAGIACKATRKRLAMN
jgi:hypothetical protein